MCRNKCPLGARCPQSNILDVATAMASSVFSAPTCAALLFILCFNCGVRSTDVADHRFEEAAEYFTTLTNEYIENVDDFVLTPEQLMILLPKNYPKEQLRSTLKRGGLEMDEKLDQEELQLFVILVHERALFISQDGEPKNFITQDEFNKYMEKKSLTPEEVSDLYKSGDTNGDGRMEFFEFHLVISVALSELTAFHTLAKDRGFVHPDNLRKRSVTKKLVIDVHNSVLTFVRNMEGVNSTVGTFASNKVKGGLSWLRNMVSEHGMDGEPIENTVPQYALNYIRDDQFDWLLGISGLNRKSKLNLPQFKTLSRNYEMILIYNGIDTNKNGNISKLELLSATEMYRPTEEFAECLEECFEKLQVFGLGSKNIDELRDALLLLSVMSVYQENDPEDDGLGLTEFGEAASLLLGDNIFFDVFCGLLKNSDKKTNTNFNFAEFKQAVSPSYAKVFTEQYRFLGL